MSGEVLASLAGVVVQLFFAYFPGVKSWYEAQSGAVKGGMQIGILALLAFGGFLPVCLGWFTNQIPLTCDQAGVEQAVINFVLALAVNQGLYATLVRPLKKGSFASVKPL